MLKAGILVECARHFYGPLGLTTGHIGYITKVFELERDFNRKEERVEVYWFCSSNENKGFTTLMKLDWIKPLEKRNTK